MTGLKNTSSPTGISIYFTVCDPQNRWKDRANHELYCAGHLMEAAVAYYEATGEDRFLNCMRKYADYIYRVFVEEQSAAFTTPGHEEIELALIRMYRCTGTEKYLDLAKFFIDNRGVREEGLYDYTKPEYAQSHLPVRQQKTAEGHAVRACYLYTAMAALAKETGDPALLDSCKAIFNDIVNKKMYITGGIGSTHIGEAFTLPYDLPNDTAYNETCASIGMMLFCKSMLNLEHHTAYADVIERELYNGMLSGLSLDGKAFFYENPLEIHLNHYRRHTATHTKERYPITQRREVFDCSCCPPNINRILASIQGYIYAYDHETYYINQFAESEMHLNGRFIKQTTRYPLDGTIEIECRNIEVLMIRIPDWCDAYTVGCKFDVVGGYIKIENPEKLTVVFRMEPFLVQAASEVAGNVGKAALQYGPVVYCVEGIDNCENLHALYVSQELHAKIEYNREFGLNTIETDGFIEKPPGKLYTRLQDDVERTRIKFIPYSCFANRGETNMLVWLHVR